MLSESVRAAFYRLAAAVIAALVAKGIISEDESLVWGEFVVAAVGLLAALLASANTKLRG